MAERNKVIVEGAGAVSVAAALSGKAGSGKVACVVSGGNIDLDRLVTIIHGKIPKKYNSIEYFILTSPQNSRPIPILFS